MYQACPYCGGEYRALKNHVRLTTGNGHGSSGQYPDDFEPDSSAETGGQKHSNIEGDSTEDTPEMIEIPPDEFEDMVAAIESEAYEQGRQDAKDESQVDTTEDTTLGNTAKADQVSPSAKGSQDSRDTGGRIILLGLVGLVSLILSVIAGNEQDETRRSDSSGRPPAF